MRQGKTTGEKKRRAYKSASWSISKTRMGTWKVTLWDILCKPHYDPFPCLVPFLSFLSCTFLCLYALYQLDSAHDRSQALCGSSKIYTILYTDFVIMHDGQYNKVRRTEPGRQSNSYLLDIEDLFKASKPSESSCYYQLCNK